MRELPTGTVTFLFTDIEGSTRLWEEQPEAMRLALPRHDALLRTAIEANNGHVFKTVGDAFCAVFSTAPEALDAALALQQALRFPSPSCAAGASELVLKVRAALHSGAAEEREGDYFGPALNRVARLLAVGHGGQVLLSSVTQGLVQDDLPPGASLKDLGSHRLRDLQRPEQVFQLLHADLPAIFPPLRSLSAHLNNLPQALTSFIGREKEMAEVKQRLASTRLLTLTGVGGTGKSRLSLQIAADLIEEYPEGVWLVELAPLSDPAVVAQAVATVLSIREEPGVSLLQTLVQHLKPRHLLLVLDNCEHLLTAGAELAELLLQQCPHLTILASSREGLGISGETVYRVPSLSLPDPKHLPPGQTDLVTALTAFEAVRLFTERAVAVQPSFTVTSSNALSLAEVCQRLDGIPLAIELAAARVRALPVEQIAARLNDRFRLLTGGSRTALPRQQTLRALIDWSYDLLLEEERALLPRLSVFAGGGTLEAAETVCSDAVGSRQKTVGSGEDPASLPTAYCLLPTDVLDLLTSLVDKSLLLYEEQQGMARYRLLETLRQYGSDRLLEAGEAEAVRGRHRDYFLRWAEEAEPRFFGPEQAQWSERFAQEHDNLRAALEWSLADDAAPESALRLAAAMGPFWRRRTYLAEGKQWLQRALERGHEASPAARARALYALADLLFLWPDPGSVTLFQESVALYRCLEDHRGLGWALIGLGYALKERAGDPEKARSCFEEALTLFDRVGDNRGIGWALGELGFLARDQGDLHTARALFQESMPLLRECGDGYAVAWALHGAGSVAWRQGDRQGGRRFLEESLALRREIGDASGLGWLLGEMGPLLQEAGEHEAARTALEERLALSRQVGDEREIARCLQTLAECAWRQGDQVEGRALIEQSLALARQTGDRELIAWVLASVAEMARDEGDYHQAIHCCEEALALCRDRDWPGLGWVLQNLAHAMLATGDTERAKTLFVEALDRARRWSLRLVMATSLIGLAAIALGRGEVRRAAVLLGAVQPPFEASSVFDTPAQRVAFAHWVDAARAALHSEAFSRAWEEGRTMTMEEAITHALEESSDA